MSLTSSRIGRGEEAEPNQAERGGDGGGGGGGGEKYIHEDALKLSTYGIPEQLVEAYAKRYLSARSWTHPPGTVLLLQRFSLAIGIL